MKRISVFFIVSLVCVSFIVTACGGSAVPTEPAAQNPTEPIPVTGPTAIPTQAPTDTPEPAGPLVVLIDNDEGPITPANFNTFIGFWMVGWVYDSLYIRTPELEPIPSLATSATPSADGLT